VGLFDNYAPQDFADRGGMLGRLLSLRPDLAQDQQDEDQPAQDQTAPALRQQPTGASTSGPLASAIGGALGDFYRQTILQPANDFSGYVNDAINDPAYFAHAIGPSLAGLGPIAGQLPAAVRGVLGAIGIPRPVAQSNFGDLTKGDDLGPQYHERVRQRALEDPVGHNFPASYDAEILAGDPIPKPNGYTIFRKSGSLNGNDGVFEIGVDKDGVIDHRFFRRNK
jgi:hypothetical protein